MHRQMSEAEHRQISRDSLFVLADLHVEGDRTDHKVKVRNLSAGGMMAEGPVKVLRGMPVSINLRNIGWVEGTVAWVQDSRFGIAFRDEIDPKVARAPIVPSETTPVYVRPPIPARLPGGRLRKI
jgi:hypothetical protein